MTKKNNVIKETKELGELVEVTPTKIQKNTKEESPNVIEEVFVKKPYTYINDKPFVVIGGKEIKVHEIKHLPSIPSICPEVGRRDSNIKIMLGSHTGCWGNFYEEDLQRCPIKFWTANVSGVTIYISSGSELILSNEIVSIFQDSEDYGAKTPTNKSILYVIGSKINLTRLYISGEVYFNNSIIGDGQPTGHFKESSIQCSNISANSSLVINHSFLKNVTISVKRNMFISKSSLHNFYVYFVLDIELSKVTNVEDIKISSCWENTSIYVKNIRLRGMKLECWGAEQKSSKQKQRMVIERQPDYGYFSGLNPIPFVRVREHDILVGNIIFTAKELLPELFKHDQEKSWNTEYHCTTVLSSPSERNSLFEKVKGVVYGKEKQCLGGVGTSVVNGVIDQIQSRVKLYININDILDTF